VSNILNRDNTDFRQYMQETEPQVKVIRAGAWKDALMLSTRPGQDEGAKGALLPWASSHGKVAFRPHEVSLWQGINGHGKSQLLGQAVIGFGAQEERCCIASFEMKPIATLKRALRQAAMTNQPTEEFAGVFADWLNTRLWIYDQQGSVQPNMVYAVIRYCAEKLKIRHFVVDSLMKCVQNEDDYNGQKVFVDTLTQLARDNEIHIHLVHHARKRENEEAPPGKFDAKGSGAITDLVDNVFSVWRNKKKERLVETARAKNAIVDPEVVDGPDALLVCDKQRHGEWEGRIPLWYHAPSLQYTNSSVNRPIELMRSNWG